MIPHEARYLYDWTGTSKLSYGDFLRTKQFESSIRYAIDTQTKELIASNKQLSEIGIQVLSEDIAQGFSELSEDLRSATSSIREGMADINHSIYWGFSETLASLGQMNISLTELVRLMTTPSQTWACEQFEIARDEFRRELYPEALQSVTQAIEGHGSNPGVKTQFRFHFLVGTIRLGSYKNSSATLVNPELAEQAFLASARYARADYSHEAGHSLVCAGRAAFVQGQIDRAIEHTRNGLTLAPRHAEGLYQLGRALFLKRSSGTASSLLVEAISLDAHNALRVAGDPDFGSDASFVQGVLAQAKSVYLKRYREATSRLRRATDSIARLAQDNAKASLRELKSGPEITRAFQSAEGIARPDTIFGYNLAIQELTSAFSLFPACFDDYKVHHASVVHESLSRRTGPDDMKNENAFAFLSVIGWIVAIPVAVALFFFIGSQPSPGPPLVVEGPDNRIMLRSVGFTEGLGLVLVLFGAPLLVAALIVGGAAFLESTCRENIRSHNAAMQSEYTAWRSRLEAEVATTRRMDLPEECKPPRI